MKIEILITIYKSGASCMKGVQCYPCDDFFKLSKHVVTEKTQLKSLVFSSYNHSLSVVSLIQVM